MLSEERKREYQRDYYLKHKEELQLKHREYMLEYTQRPEVKEHIRSYKKGYQRKNLLWINGKQIKVNKRPRPDDICELCNKEIERLDYHHWDDNHPEQGIWICFHCHRMVEGADTGIINKYFELKEMIIRLN